MTLIYFYRQFTPFTYAYFFIFNININIFNVSLLK